jgi:hypothetical protein
MSRELKKKTFSRFRDISYGQTDGHSRFNRCLTGMRAISVRSCWRRDDNIKIKYNEIQFGNVQYMELSEDWIK